MTSSSLPPGWGQAAQGSRRFQSLLKKLVKLFELNCFRFAWGFEATLGQLMRGSGGTGCIHMVPSYALGGCKKDRMCTHGQAILCKFMAVGTKPSWCP